MTDRIRLAVSIAAAAAYWIATAALAVACLVTAPTAGIAAWWTLTMTLPLVAIGYLVTVSAWSYRATLRAFGRPRRTR